MDANREQSDRCFELACAHLRKGERAKAVKFLQKAIRLYTGNRAAADLLMKLEAAEKSTQNGFYENGESETHTRSRFGSSQSQPNFSKHAKTKNRRQRDTPPSSSERGKNSTSRGDERTGSASPTPGFRHKSASQPQLGVDYTQEQLEMVQRVRRCKDYYEILSVTKEFTEIELKKQYRKLALQFHPDKNNAPGATEAFKAIGNAYAVLSEPKKRERYDMYGSADASSQSSYPQRSQYSEYDYSRGFEADMTAEEIFNMFFGGGFPQGNLRRRPTGHHHQQSAERENRNESGFGLLLQLTPLLILVLLSVVSQLFVPDPPFSLTRTQKYPHERQTSELKVTYFVKPDFVKTHQNGVRGVEQQVEEAYIEDLKVACSRERNKRDTVLWSAKLYSDASLYERGQQMPTHSCDRLSKIYRTLGV